jgi:hypothetical protein
VTIVHLRQASVFRDNRARRLVLNKIRPKVQQERRKQLLKAGEGEGER